jgi:hypothetical protein
MYACDAVGVNAPTERLLSVGIQCDDRGSVATVAFTRPPHRAAAAVNARRVAAAAGS